MASSFVANDPSGYEVYMGRWSRRAAVPFLKFAGLRPSDRVLDVGCGTGILSMAAADLGATVTAIDPSEAYLRFAKQHSIHPNITYEQGNGRQLRFSDASFDIVVSSLVLDVVPLPPMLSGNAAGNATRRNCRLICSGEAECIHPNLPCVGRRGLAGPERPRLTG
jgi:2-polyprenyl-3-methyl-5-hydroxy-6-metoxy-1,4-benzoquinol methylase